MGKEKALQCRKEKREWMLKHPEIASQTKGKTYEEIMGNKKAKKRKDKMKKARGSKNPFYGKKHSKEARKKIRFSWTRERKENVRKVMKESKSEYMRSFINKEKQTQMLSKWCKDGHAAYMNMFIKNPSKPQIELYKMVLELCPYAIINYPCLNYSIDIAIPFLEVAIEYDEPYWHQDKDYDSKRQRRLEKEGWRFIRFSSIPKKKEIRREIKAFSKI